MRCAPDKSGAIVWAHARVARRRLSGDASALSAFTFLRSDSNCRLAARESAFCVSMTSAHTPSRSEDSATRGVIPHASAPDELIRPRASSRAAPSCVPRTLR